MTYRVRSFALTPRAASSSHHEADQHILLQYPRAISNVDRDVVTIYESDLDHLSPGSFLNDNIIAFYLKYITNEVFTGACVSRRLMGSPRPWLNVGAALASCQLHHKQRVHIFSSFFYQKLVAHGYDAVRKWTGDVNIFDKASKPPLLVDAMQTRSVFTRVAACVRRTFSYSPSTRICTGTWRWSATRATASARASRFGIRW